jgi:hypothetical protein
MLVEGVARMKRAGMGPHSGYFLTSSHCGGASPPHCDDLQLIFDILFPLHHKRSLPGGGKALVVSRSTNSPGSGNQEEDGWGSGDFQAGVSVFRADFAVANILLVTLVMVCLLRRCSRNYEKL